MYLLKYIQYGIKLSLANLSDHIGVLGVGNNLK
jgi:hypothetical protein